MAVTDIIETHNATNRDGFFPQTIMIWQNDLKIWQVLAKTCHHNIRTESYYQNSLKSVCLIHFVKIWFTDFFNEEFLVKRCKLSQKSLLIQSWCIMEVNNKG